MPPRMEYATARVVWVSKGDLRLPIGFVQPALLHQHRRLLQRLRVRRPVSCPSTRVGQSLSGWTCGGALCVGRTSERATAAGPRTRRPQSSRMWREHVRSEDVGDPWRPSTSRSGAPTALPTRRPQCVIPKWLRPSKDLPGPSGGAEFVWCDYPSEVESESEIARLEACCTGC